MISFFEPRSADSRAAARRSADRIAGRTSGRSPAVPVEFARSNLAGDPSAPIFPALPGLEALRATMVPILHVGGDHDIIFPVENWYALNQSQPTVQLLTYPSTASSAPRGGRRAHRRVRVRKPALRALDAARARR